MTVQPFFRGSAGGFLFYNGALCCHSLGFKFLAGLFVWWVGAALWVLLLPLKTDQPQKQKTMCCMWVGYKKHDKNLNSASACGGLGVNFPVSMDGTFLIYFASLPGYSTGNVLCCLHIYALQNIGPVVNYSSSASG